MGREIKFRVWIGSQMEHNIMAGFLGAYYVQGISYNDSSFMSEFNTKYLDETPLMQFTGLTDKHGFDIYEGDIVKRKTHDWDKQDKWEDEENPDGSKEVLMFYKEEASFVVYRDSGFWIDAEGFGYEGENLWEWSQVEVIGNIYENADLLNTNTN